MSSDYVKVRGITERVGEGDDARTVNLTLGQEVPSDLPSSVADRLRKSGAIGPREATEAPPVAPRDRASLDATGRGANPEGGEEGVQAPGDGGGSSTAPPEGAPDPGSVSTAELAAWIDSESPNASQTVALARNDPALAQAVLDAELAASGGDGRSTVVGPLEKLRDAG